MEQRQVTPRLHTAPVPDIGIVTPHDLALDRELWRWSADDVVLYVTRLPYVPDPVGVGMTEAIGDHTLVASACQDVSVLGATVTAYLCASGSFVGGVRGEAALRDAMQAGGATRAITTSGALVVALTALGVARVGVATPYDVALTNRLVNFLGEAGYETVAAAYLGLTSDIAKVTPDCVRDLALAVAHDDAEPVIEIVLSSGERLQVRAGASADLVRAAVSALRSTC